MWQQHFAKSSTKSRNGKELPETIFQKKMHWRPGWQLNLRVGAFQLSSSLCMHLQPFPSWYAKQRVYWIYSCLCMVTGSHQGYCQGAMTAQSSQCSNAPGGVHSTPHIIRGCCNKCTLTPPSLAPQPSLLCCLNKPIQPPTMRTIFSLGGKVSKQTKKLFIHKIASPWPLFVLISAFDCYCSKNPVIFSACSEFPFPSQHLTKQSEQWSYQIKIQLFHFASKRGTW